MKKLKSKNGITLIALIITIIILLILAIVTINILINQGIIGHAQTAVQKYDEQQVKEDILLTYDEYKMQKFGPNAKSLYDFFNERYDDVEDNGDGSITVTVESNGNTYAYTLKEDGTLENAKGLLLDKTSVVLNLENNKKLTDTLKVTLRGIEGDATWSISSSTYATISSTTGEEITITAKKQGETKITVTCGDYKKECTVSVLNGLPIGEYINYDCFTGVDSSKLYYKSPKEKTGYGTDQEFQVTENPKWKILGKDDNGKLLITAEDVLKTKGNKKFFLRGQKGYANGMKELDNISKICACGGKALDGRSINFEDIATVNNYTPKEIQYYTYTLNKDGYIYCDGNKTRYQTFTYYNENAKVWKTLIEDESVNIPWTYKNIEANVTRSGGVAVATDSYYLASKAIIPGTNDCTEFLYQNCYHVTGTRWVTGGTGALYYSQGSEGLVAYAVRPVVTLDITEVNNKVDGVWQIE